MVFGLSYQDIPRKSFKYDVSTNCRTLAHFVDILLYIVEVESNVTFLRSSSNQLLCHIIEQLHYVLMICTPTNEILLSSASKLVFILNACIQKSNRITELHARWFGFNSSFVIYLGILEQLENLFSATYGPIESLTHCVLFLEASSALLDNLVTIAHDG